MDNGDKSSWSSSPNSSPNYDLTPYQAQPSRGRPLTGKTHFRRNLFPDQVPAVVSPPMTTAAFFQGFHLQQTYQMPTPTMDRSVIYNSEGRQSVPPSLRNRSPPPATFGPRLPSPASFGPRPGRECKFCRNNGETSSLYRSHVLRNPATGQLVCPILRAHVCEICGGTQDNAHTRNYCPKLKEEKKMKYAVPICLKKTKRQSDGQLRQ